MPCGRTLGRLLASIVGLSQEESKLLRVIFAKDDAAQDILQAIPLGRVSMQHVLQQLVLLASVAPGMTACQHGMQQDARPEYHVRLVNTVAGIAPLVAGSLMR